MTNVLLQPPIYIDVLEYGADPTGASDSTTAVQAAINAAAGGVTNGTNTVGAGVIFPAGTYLVTGLVLYSFIHLYGHGPEATIIKLKNASNADIVQGYNAPALIGTNNIGGIINYGLYNLTIDGNKSNQSGASYGIRAYGFGHRIENVRVRNCFSDGMYLDWNGGGTTSGFDQMEGYCTNSKFHDNNGMGVNFHGPHDSMFSNITSCKNGSHMFYQGPNAGGTQWINCHGWSGGVNLGTNSVAWLIESQAMCVSCEGEGSDFVQVAMLASNCVWSAGRIFSGNTAGNNVSGLQIGQIASLTLKSAATTSPITLTTNPTLVALGGAFLQFVISGAGGSGTIAVSGTNAAGTTVNDNLSPTGNGSFTTTNAYVTVTSITWTGLTGASINVVGLGLPFAGSNNQSGGVTTAVQVSGYFVDNLFSRCEGSNGSVWFANENGGGFIRGLVVLNQSGDPSNANVVSTGATQATTHYMLIPSGTTADGTIGKGGRLTIPINATKGVVVGDGTQDLFTMDTHDKRYDFPNGTFLKGYSDNYSTTAYQLDSTLSTTPSTSAAAIATSGTATTSGVGVCRLSPSGAVTGCILQAGTRNAQQVWVVNEAAAANSISWATAATSHIAGESGGTFVLAGQKAQLFVWSTALSLWVKAS